MLFRSSIGGVLGWRKIFLVGWSSSRSVSRVHNSPSCSCRGNYHLWLCSDRLVLCRHLTGNRQVSERGGARGCNSASRCRADRRQERFQHYHRQGRQARLRQRLRETPSLLRSRSSLLTPLTQTWLCATGYACINIPASPVSSSLPTGC